MTAPLLLDALQIAWVRLLQCDAITDENIRTAPLKLVAAVLQAAARGEDDPQSGWPKRRFASGTRRHRRRSTDHAKIRGTFSTVQNCRYWQPARRRAFVLTSMTETDHYLLIGIMLATGAYLIWLAMLGAGI